MCALLVIANPATRYPFDLMTPILVVNNPLFHNYDAVIGLFLKMIDPQVILVEVHVLDHIRCSDHLNIVLTTLYTSTRVTATKLGWDHTLLIHVSCNKNLEASRSRYSTICTSKDVVLTDIDEPVEILLSELVHHDLTQGVSAEQDENRYQTVAVGGTFDHLHDGHKILLSMASFLAAKTIIVGITGPKLLVNKKFADFLEPYNQRKHNVDNFLNVFSGVPAPAYYEINDICGPTGYIKDIDALVVSRESAKGGEFVNKFRQEKHFPPLHIVTINVVGGEGDDFDGKLSSTAIREAESKKTS